MLKEREVGWKGEHGVFLGTLPYYGEPIPGELGMETRPPSLFGGSSRTHTVDTVTGGAIWNLGHVSVAARA